MHPEWTNAESLPPSGRIKVTHHNQLSAVANSGNLLKFGDLIAAKFGDSGCL